MVSSPSVEGEEKAPDQRSRRVKARASEKVGVGLAYQAAWRTGRGWPASWAWVARVTSEKRPKTVGVVQSSACGLNAPAGSRRRTHRRLTAGRPARYQTAVPVVFFLMIRRPP